jgi:hypothetical protein
VSLTERRSESTRIANFQHNFFFKNEKIVFCLSSKSKHYFRLASCLVLIVRSKISWWMLFWFCRDLPAKSFCIWQNKWLTRGMILFLCLQRGGSPWLYSRSPPRGGTTARRAVRFSFSASVFFNVSGWSHFRYLLFRYLFLMWAFYRQNTVNKGKTGLQGLLRNLE